MRIRDASVRKIRSRTFLSLLAATRARSAELSNGVSTFFLRDVQHLQHEEDLLRKRQEKIANTTFNHDSVDDQACLQRFRFTKADINRIIEQL